MAAVTKDATSGGAAVPPEPYDFSLVLGGPLYQLYRRARLTGDALELLRRRLVAVVSIAWVPLLVLSAWEGNAWGGAVTIPFLYDADVQARFLLALPLLVVAERIVHIRLRPVIGEFLKRDLVPEPALPRFDAAVAAATRLRNSVAAELLLIAVVYGVGVLFLWRRFVAIDVPIWYGVHGGGRLQPSLAGWWFGLVSLPLMQFLLLRWYFRLFVWTRFLWQVSRIDLDLKATHHDRAGGLGFLSLTGHAFTPLLLAQGVLLSGMMANRIFFTGARLPQFRVEIVGLVAFMLFTVLAPLLVFVPLLERVKRTALREYGGLAHRYAREFDRKWLRGGAPPDEALLGSADIQSLADLGNSLQIVKEMKLFPFNPRVVIQLGVVTLLPVLPLALTMVSLDELVQRVLRIVF